MFISDLISDEQVSPHRLPQFQHLHRSRSMPPTHDLHYEVESQAAINSSLEASFIIKGAETPNPSSLAVLPPVINNDKALTEGQKTSFQRLFTWNASLDTSLSLSGATN